MKKNLRFLLALAIGWLTSTSVFAIEPVDGVYKIGTAEDWKEFCELHNNGSDQKLNAELTADIVVDGNIMVGINGGGKPYRGVFDGKGHKLTVAYELNEERVAPFRRINGATIKNLVVEGTINTSSKLAAGLVGGLWQSGSLIQNCVSYVVITDTYGGDATHGGICGSFEDVNGANTIENCAFLGTINAPNREGCGGIVGWTNNNNNNNIIRNCLVNAHGFNVLRLSNNDIICRNNGNVENCYFIGSTDGFKNDKGAIQATEAQAASGELCFLLNGSQSATPAWFQTIGTDDMPSPFGTDIVYANGSLKCDGTPKDDVTYSNTASEPQRDEHQWNDWGFCANCDEIQPDFLTLDSEGYYLIADKKGYNWFMMMVNEKGQPNINGKLTQDLDLSDYTFIPIGVDQRNYAGTFDGQGHRILNMTIDGTKKEQGFFSTCQGGAVIKNLIIDSSCKMVGTGGSNVAALIGCINHNNFNNEEILIQNVGNEMSFNCSTTNNAGFIARDFSNFLKVRIENCYNTGNIMGGVENGAFTAWTPRVTLTNCWNTGRIEKTGGYDGSKSLARGNQPKFINSYDLNSENTDNAGAPDGYAEAWMASGQLCYVMNGKQSTDVSWYQEIGTDMQPMPFGTAIVYANGNLQCDGLTPVEGSELTFSNTEGNTIADHEWNDWGFCKNCDTLQPDFMTPAADGAFEIADNKQLNWFAMYLNQSANKNIDARLTADIDFSAQQVMIGNGDNDDAYQGTFDGQGHKVTLGYAVNQKNVALFRYLKNATIKNLITDGTIQNEDNSCSGGIFAGSRGATVVENCVSYVNFKRESSGDATIGGIGAYMHDNGSLRNVAFYGSVEVPNAEGNGGLLGYANGGGNVSVVNAVINATKFEVSGNSVSIARNTGNVTNVYVVNCGTSTQTEAKIATEAQLASGELCFLLNGSVSGGTDWYQLLGTDAAPLPIVKEGAVIYTANDLTCDGKPKGDAIYTNTAGAVNQDEHQWNDWGFCTVCDEVQPDYMTATNGVFELGNEKQVNWFAHYATKIDATANAALTADIDMKEVNGFPGIGNPDKPYTGTFDGQGHKISNLTLDNQATENPAGFFNEASAGAVIKNFSIDNTCYIVGHHFVSAFVGHVAGNGEVLLQQLGNEAEVTAWEQNAGGIVGCNTSGELKLTIENCYNTGTISSARESGGLSGWLGNDAKTINCYNMGSVSGDGSESFARGNNIQITNCFDPVTNWPALPASPIEDFTNGTVYKALSEAAPGVWFLSAAENGYPVLYNTGITTGIENVNVNLNDNSRIYNLNGQEVKKPAKGLYIINGKKQFVR